MENQLSALKDLGEYKMTLLNMIIQSNDISNAMYKENKNIKLSQLIYKQIFPFLYVDETQTDVLSYICFDDAVPRVPTGTVKNMQLTVLVYAHRKCMQYDSYTGTRVDALTDYVDRVIMDEENRKKFGIGRPKLESVNNAFPHNDYYGKQLIYTIPDFKVKEV